MGYSSNYMIAYQWDITEYESSLMRYDSNYKIAYQ